MPCGDSNYVSTVHVDTTLQSPYAGQVPTVKCSGPLVANYYSAPILIDYSHVYSYRGPKRTHETHCFRRELLKVVRICPFILCVNGRWEGSDNNFLPKPSHRNMSNSPPYGYTGFDQQLQAYEFLRDSVKSELFAKANDPAISAGVILAELKETLEYLVVLLARALKLLTRGLLRSAEGALFTNRAEGHWLEYRYALLPLILDLGDIIKVIREGITSRTKVQNSILPYTVDSYMSHELEMSCGYFPYETHVQGVVKVGSALTLLSHSDPSPYGLGAFDTIIAAWETVPWSFIIDWFIDIGTWLRSFRNAGLEVSSSYCTLVTDLKYRMYSSGEVDEKTGYSVDYIDYPTKGVPHEWDILVIDREIDIKPPSFPVSGGGINSIIRVLDSAAFTTQALRGLRRLI